MIKITPRKIAIGIAVTIVVVGLVAILVIAPPASPILAGVLAVGALIAEEGLKILIEKAQAKYEKWRKKKNGESDTDERPHVKHYDSIHLDTPNGFHYSRRRYSDQELSDDEDTPVNTLKIPEQIKRKVKFKP